MNTPKPKYTPPMPKCIEPKPMQYLYITLSKDEAVNLENSIGHKVIFKVQISNNCIKSADVYFNDAVIESVRHLDDENIEIRISTTGFEIEGELNYDES